jgi:AcrR family transcriptional regulator
MTAESARQPRRGRRRPAERRLEIVQTAISLADSAGLDRLTSREIGAALGVAPALVHHYFASMDELAVAALKHHADTSRRDLKDAVNALPPLPALCTYVVRMLEMTRTSASMWLSAWVTGTRREDLAAEMARQDEQDIELLAELLERGRSTGTFLVIDPQAAALRVIVVLDGITVHMARRDRADLAYVDSLMWDTVEREAGLPVGTLRPRTEGVIND